MKNIEGIIESLYENRGSLVPIIGDEMFVYGNPSTALYRGSF